MKVTTDQLCEAIKVALQQASENHDLPKLGDLSLVFDPGDEMLTKISHLKQQLTIRIYFVPEEMMTLATEDPTAMGSPSGFPFGGVIG